MMSDRSPSQLAFNSPIEVGLRSLVTLLEAYPEGFSVQQLVFFDYFVVHTDDLPGGPRGLHPKTPHRGGELLVRRQILQDGLSLYRSRGLLLEHFTPAGFRYSSSEAAAPFVDSLSAPYVDGLRERAAWVVAEYGDASVEDLAAFVSERVGDWGAEFEMESVLWEEGEDIDE